MDSQIQEFVAAQREKAAQVLAQYNEREHAQSKDRDRERRRERWRDHDRDHGDHDDRVRNRHDGSRDRDRSSERSRRSYDDDRSYSRSSNGRSDENSSGRGGLQSIDYNHGQKSERDDDSRSHRSSDRDDRERSSDKWMTDTPTNTVLLRGLPSKVEEEDIRAELMMFGAPVKDVRLMKRKDTGASRGFAFVEFQNEMDSQRWMEQNQGQLTLLNQYTISMFYSTPKTGGNDVRPPGDWTCSKCGVHNFKRRDHCFKCSISKDESDRSKEGEGYDQVGHNLCNTVIFRGLDALTTEENIMAAVLKTAPVVVKNVRIIRDPQTQVGKGYAFAEMGSIGDSCKLIDAISKLLGPFEVDGKAIIVNYAKNTFSTVMATMNQQWTAGGQTYNYTDSSQFAAQGYYDSAGNFHYYDYSQYYSQDAYAQNYQEDTTQSDTTNAAAAVAQAAIQQAQAAKAVQKKQDELQKKLVQNMHHAQKTNEESIKQQAQQWARKQESPTVSAASVAEATTVSKKAKTTNAPTMDAPADFVYPVPDVSTYQYDETSGYYYDPATGLYYDANSQYYYNSQTGQFLYWDGERRTYLPAPDYQQQQGGLLPGQDQGDKKEREKKDKVKVAKKIAKDMEKWAKSMNAQKEALKDTMIVRPTAAQIQEKKETAAADAGFAILEKVKNDPSWKSESSLMPPPAALPGGQKGSPSSGLVPDYGDAEDSEEDMMDDTDNDEKFSDWTKMACLLCKRQFPNREGLQRHNQLSDLHKKNLEDHRKKKAPSQASLTAVGKLQYRDRAKERRQKYGAPAPPEPRKGNAKAPVPYEQPTKQGIGEDNIGNKLMKKMGWSSGQGLGRGKSGIKDPIQAQRRTMGAGLGATGSAIQLEPGDSYKDAVKKTMMARFQEMNS